MIPIYDIDGTVLYQVLETSPCVKDEELMVSDHIKLSWFSRTGESIPAGAYIKHQIGEDEDEEPIYEIYTLLENYKPVQKSEASWLFEPEFQSSIMGWQKVPFFMYTPIYDDDDEITGYTRETDWSLTGGANVFLERIAVAIFHETGVEYEFSSDAPGSKSINFSSVDVLSALNSIANEFETEWWVDKDNLTIHLSKCNRGGTAVNLEVGNNINVPSVSLNSEGFYNRFYVFGSTRNIVQSYQGAGVNNLVNKRLTLDPEDYPGGYYEPHELAEGQQPFSKILIFDDIYPAATTLEAYDVRAELRYVVDDAGNRIQIGTDSAGNPVYDEYAVYYIKVRYPDPEEASGYKQYIYNDWDYSEKPERQGGEKPGLEGQKIAGLVPSIHFDSGSLLGREFEIAQIHEEKTVKGLNGTPVTIYPGDIEIKYAKNDNYIIPDMTTLTPKAGDKVILFNIKMPDEYIVDAYDRLEAKMLEEIEEKYTSDQNQYSFDSNPAAFNQSNPNLKIGTAVNYKNGLYTLATRVTKLTTKIDKPVVQNITVGNSLVKGTIQELKENITTANKNIDFITALNDSTKAFVDAYNRTQQTILENFKSISGLFSVVQYSTNRWALKVNSTAVDASGTTRGLDGFFTDGFLSGNGASAGTGGGGGGASTLRELNDVLNNGSAVTREDGTAAQDGDLFVYDVSTHKWCAIAQSSISPEVDLSEYLKKTEASSTYQPIIDATHKLAANLISGLASVATTGSYSDLSNKPTKSDFGLGNVENKSAAQILADLTEQMILDALSSDKKGVLNSGATQALIAQITTNKNNITGLTTRMGTAETSITGLGTRMTAAEGDIDAAQADIIDILAELDRVGILADKLDSWFGYDASKNMVYVKNGTGASGSPANRGFFTYGALSGGGASINTEGGGGGGGDIPHVFLTQAEYDALGIKDPDTLYFTYEED